MLQIIILIAAIIIFRKEALKRKASPVKWIAWVIAVTMAPGILLQLLVIGLPLVVGVSETTLAVIMILSTLLSLGISVWLLFFLYNKLKEEHPLEEQEEIKK